MKRFGKWRGIATPICLLAALLLVLAGCQSVGGLDVGKALTSGLTVNSSEGQGSVSIALELNENADMNSEEAKLFKLFNPLTITIDSAKQSGAMTQSVKGSIGYAKGDIPFELSIDQGAIALQIEGVDRPVVLDSSNLSNSEGGSFPLQGLQDLQNQLMPKMQDLLKVAADFFVKNAPNPNTISVESVSQTIHGETTSLHKVHAEIYGDELLGLVKQTLQNILDDEDGLQALLGQVYDVVVPLLQESMKDQDGLNDVQTGMLSNKVLAVSFLNSMVKQALQSFLDDFDNQAAELDLGIFNTNNYFKIDYYVDNELMARKSDFELRIEPQVDEAEALKAVVITGAFESWNINGEVTVDAIDASGGIPLDLEANPVGYLKYIDHDSQLYALLKNDLQVTRKTVVLNMNESADTDSAVRPYIKQYVTLVPARFISEELNAEVGWEGSTQTVTIVDLETGKTIVIRIGSDETTVDGQKQKLELAAEITNDTTFLPLRFISQQLGGTVHWDEATQVITITRN